MNRKQNEGSSLIEVLVAIALLGLIAASTAAGLVLSHRLNARSEELLQAQLRLSSCLEILRAEGIDPDRINAESGIPLYPVDTLENITVKTERVAGETLYYVTVTDDVTGETICTWIGGAP